MAKIDVPIGRKMSALVSREMELRKSFTTGSYEDHMKLVRPYLIAGSGCEHPEPVGSNDGMSIGAPGSHYQDVVATFPEYGIVLCNTEDAAWRVPYEVDGDEVTTGEPEQVEQMFVPVGDGDGEVDDEEEDD